MEARPHTEFLLNCGFVFGSSYVIIRGNGQSHTDFELLLNPWKSDIIWFLFCFFTQNWHSTWLCWSKREKSSACRDTKSWQLIQANLCSSVIQCRFTQQLLFLTAKKQHVPEVYFPCSRKLKLKNQQTDNHDSTYCYKQTLQNVYSVNVQKTTVTAQNSRPSENQPPLSSRNIEDYMGNYVRCTKNIKKEILILSNSCVATPFFKLPCSFMARTEQLTWRARLCSRVWFVISCIITKVNGFYYFWNRTPIKVWGEKTKKKRPLASHQKMQTTLPATKRKENSISSSLTFSPLIIFIPPLTCLLL